MTTVSDVASGPRRPPKLTTGPIAWVRANLFSSWTNTILTVVSIYIAARVAMGVFDWAVVHATFSGADGAACTREGSGACWPFISAKFSQFMCGRYPEEERWRVDLTYVLALAGLVPLMIPRAPGKLWLSLYVLFVFPVIAFVLLVGGMFGLPHVGTELWGGLLVTLVVSITGIVTSLPLGILLALGRRSHLPAVRIFSVCFIEFWRGVPLITVLFFATYMLPLFLPGDFTIDALVRVLVGIALFAGAYNAEVIRGGLLAIPRGQREAANALGLSYWKTTGLIVLPQALRHVIPALVNSFIALFKDTTLVLIVAIFDPLGQLRAAFADPTWATPTTLFTGFAFTGIIYWVGCFAMSRYSLFVERRLNAHRNT